MSRIEKYCLKCKDNIFSIVLLFYQYLIYTRLIFINDQLLELKKFDFNFWGILNKNLIFSLCLEEAVIKKMVKFRNFAEKWVGGMW